MAQGNKKYILIGGYVYKGRERDFVSADRLVMLYRLHREECILIRDEFDPNLNGLKFADYLVLHPMSNGDYSQWWINTKKG